MSDDDTATDTGRWVALVGGPPGMTRVQLAPLDSGGDASRVLVVFYGRNKHFEITGEAEWAEGRLVPVFRFAYSTAIAE